MDAEALLADARRRNAAARRRSPSAATGDEASEVARINKDTRAINSFLRFFKSHPQYCGGVLVLPSGRRHQLGGAKRMEVRPGTMFRPKRGSR
jgi:hypothetical protein